MLQFGVGSTTFYAVVQVHKGSISRVIRGPVNDPKRIQREDAEFSEILDLALRLICEEKPGVFMSLYRYVRDHRDMKAFAVAEAIRIEKKSQNKLYEEVE